VGWEGTLCQNGRHDGSEGRGARGGRLGEHRVHTSKTCSTDEDKGGSALVMCLLGPRPGLLGNELHSFISIKPRSWIRNHPIWSYEQSVIVSQPNYGVCPTTNDVSSILL
jgi:hypothetical protein